MGVLERVKEAYAATSHDDDGGEAAPVTARELFDEFASAMGVTPKDPETAFEAFCALLEAKLDRKGGGVAIMVE